MSLNSPILIMIEEMQTHTMCIHEYPLSVSLGAGENNCKCNLRAFFFPVVYEKHQKCAGMIIRREAVIHRFHVKYFIGVYRNVSFETIL